MGVRMCRRTGWWTITNNQPFTACGYRSVRPQRPMPTVFSPSGKSKAPSWAQARMATLCVVYEEVSEGLDGMEWSRYWLLSDHWHMRHLSTSCATPPFPTHSEAKRVQYL